MSDKKKIYKQVYKPRPISGYPEWLPQVRRVEQQWLDHIRKVFESYGFCNIETPAVEALEVIAAKGEDVDKEIYVLERLQADPDEKKEARLALHFDQTVPLARYVGQHFNDLVFPFKRYQTQKVWRGERPQAGRFREFTQCDIDVINVDHLPLSFDAEMPRIVHEVLSGLDIPEFQIRISNRKILIGVIKNKLGIESKEGTAEVLRVVDKLEKMELNEFLKLLNDAIFINNPNCEMDEVNRFVKLLAALQNDKKPDIKKQIAALEQLTKQAENNITTVDGLKELIFVLKSLAHLPEGSVVADLSIVRGLDYYTGTVYETMFVDDPSYGSICSGGRYDDLASSYINKKLPGVGISIGFSRLFAKMEKSLEAKRISPADVLVILNSEDDRVDATAIADTLRKNGNAVELYHAPQKFSKQMSYAEKKGIPFVWMPPFGDTKAHEVKNMATGEQTQAEPTDWKANA